MSFGRSIASLALCALFAPSVWSAEPASPVKAPAAAASEPVAALKVAPSTAVFLRTSTETLTVAAVTAQFELFDREMRTLTSRFSQHLTMAETGMSQEVDGTVSYMKPEMLRIERSRPERQTIVFDGKDIWVWLPQRNQVIQLSLEDLKRSDPLASSLLQFGSYAKMLRTYDVSLDPGAARPSVALRPKDRTVDFTLRFELEPRTLFPAQTTLAVQGMRIVSAFTDYRFNPDVDPGLFKFSPPTGAEIIRNLKPPKVSP